MSPMSPRKVFALVLAASLLLQAAWILAVPAFRGIDEFDHVYRAEAVAHGQLLDHGPAEEGRGGLVTARRSVVEAAGPVCRSYAYTGPDNCRVVQGLEDGTVTVASAASRYNPVYYALVGFPAQLADGATAVFVMRAISAVMCSLLIAWAAVVTVRRSRTHWPLLALLLAATPVLMYSTVVAAPNGMGYAAALLFWASGLGIVDGQRPVPFGALVVGSSLVMVAHPTGPVWILVGVVALACLHPIHSWLATITADLSAWMGTTVALLSVALGSSAWIIFAKPNARGRELGEVAHGSLPSSELISGLMVWPFQTIAAFPIRNEMAPVPVYVLWLLLFAALMIVAMRAASARVRTALTVLVTVWFAVPVALTYWSYNTEGVAWQGRYALPLAVGLTALAGYALDRRHSSPTPFAMGILVLGCAAAHVLSVLTVAAREAERGYPATLMAGPTAVVAVLGATAVVGALLPLGLLRRPT